LAQRLGFAYRKAMAKVLARMLGVAVSLGCSGLAAPAFARVEAGSSYTKAQTFSGALRLLRVDRGYEVVEKDVEAAYVLFRYPLPGQKTHANGALEVVETTSGVKIFVQLARMPEYQEALLRDALLKKLREDYGPPPPKPAPAPPAKPSPPADSPKKPAPAPAKPDEDSDDN
jgi:hypothetical protein